MNNADLEDTHKIDIYDRNFGKDDSPYQFPEDYRPFIAGHLPFNEIEKAYKGYVYSLNMNSIKQSQSMFARRVYELLGCNTITVSNFSRGLSLIFGDLVVCSDDGAQVRNRLEALNDETVRRKFRLLGLRKIMSEHTAQDRLAYVVSKARGKILPTLLPTIFVTAYAKNQEQMDALVASYSRQIYANRRLCLVVPDGFAEQVSVEDDTIHIFETSIVRGRTLAAIVGEAPYIAGMTPDDYYGPNYLTDLALATRYFEGQGIGKAAHYVCQRDGEICLEKPGGQYRPMEKLAARAGLVAIDVIGEIGMIEWVTSLYTYAIEAHNLLAIDEFNYCKNGGAAQDNPSLSATVDDLSGCDSGMDMAMLISRAESIVPDPELSEAESRLSAAELAALFKPSASRNLSATIDGREWRIDSCLPDQQHEYLYATKELTPAAIGSGKLHLETTPGLNIQLAMIYLDQNRQRISHEIFPANRNATCYLPKQIAYIRLGLRFYGSGQASIKSLMKGHKSLSPGTLLNKARHLVLTNHYPQYDDIYRNGFVHSRVANYRWNGMLSGILELRRINEMLLNYNYDVGRNIV